MFDCIVIDRCLRKLEEFRLQSSLQVNNKTSKTINRTRILIFTQVQTSYFSLLLPPIFNKDNHSKTNLFVLNLA